MDILLDPSTHDCVFINGQSPMTLERVEIVTQRLKIRLLTFLEEWVFNTAYGVPYFQRILAKKNIKKTDIDLIFQQEILRELGVREITFFSSTFKNRQYDMSFRVKVDTGAETQTIFITPQAL